MEGYRQEELVKKDNRFYKLFDVLTGVVFGGLITLGIVFLIRLLLLKP